VGIKSRVVGHRFLTQDKNRVSDWSFGCNAIACLIPHGCLHLKKSVRLIRAENKRTQLCLQIELGEGGAQSSFLFIQKVENVEL